MSVLCPNTPQDCDRVTVRGEFLYPVIPGVADEDGAILGNCHIPGFIECTRAAQSPWLISAKVPQLPEW